MDAPGLLNFTLILLALLAGGALGWWLGSRAARASAQAALLAGAVFEERARGLEAQLQQARMAQAEADGLARGFTATLTDRAARISELETELIGAAKNQAENEGRLKALVADTEKRFTDAFKSLASQILEEKTAKFTETNQVKLNELLEPFRERLKDFQKKIEDTHLTETTERRSLKDELKRLLDLNQQVSQDTKNLTSALKGEAKTQGTWGEIILERVLEMSGLVKGMHYDVQDSRLTEDGDRQQPDVVIRLPDKRNLVVDSKVSLVAFERYASATDDAGREAALASHLLSVRNHIRSLSEKNYPALYGLESLDFVLMFIPVEPAFMLAVQGDPQLYKTGWDRNVVLVSPTTLMATARVVNSVWQLENQNRNVLKIAEQAGRMHDTFVLFIGELEKALKQVQAAGESLDLAFKRLHTGKGNLVQRADNIRKLGAKAAKQLPANLLEITDDAPLESVEASDPEADPSVRH